MSSIEKYVKKAKNGVQSAFEKLYKLTEKDVWFTCITLIKHEENAKDVFQNTYITAFSKINTLEDDKAFPSWIKRIAVNKCKDFFKGKVEYQIEDDYMNDFVETDELKIPEEYINKNEKRKIILKLMEDNLSYVQYQTVFMHYFNNMSVTDIAEDMGCSEGTVKSRLNSARAKMKTAITEYESKNNDKLHSAVLIPLFSSVFESELKAVVMPKINFKIPIEGGKGAINVVSNGTNTIGTATANGLFVTAKAKIIATICLSTFVIAIIGTVAVLTDFSETPKNNPLDSIGYTTPTLSVEDKAIVDKGLNVDYNGNIVDDNGNKVDVSDDGTVEIKTEDGEVVKVDAEQITQANINNQNIETSTENKKESSTTNSANNDNSNNHNQSDLNVENSTTSNGEKTWHEAVYKTVNHPAVTKKVNHPAETKVVNHPAETKKINHPAETKKVKVVDKEAYTIEEPVFEWQMHQVCNDCGIFLEDMSEDVKCDHLLNHLDAGGKGSFMTKNVQVQTGTKTVTVPEEFHYETVTVKEAWTETVTVKEAWSETVVVKEAWTETVTVKEAWTEKVLVKEAGWY